MFAGIDGTRAGGVGNQPMVVAAFVGVATHVAYAEVPESLAHVGRDADERIWCARYADFPVFADRT
jgi:hypothetical protein